ncbi:MAG: DegV family protein [Clostridia bacterium]|nr:DegV family protein [Clostridia bacterium]
MFTIITDTSANLDRRWLEEHRVLAIPFHYFVKGQDCTCLDTESFDGASFYNAMRAGEKVTTSQITPQAYLDMMRPVLERGEDILYISMSSGISGSYSQAEFSAAELREEFPERTIYTVDTLSASLGEGLQVARAVEWRDRGETIQATYEMLMELRHPMCQVFTVDDLKYLRNTGRLSNMAAIVGMVLNIKPLLKGNTEGKIVSFAKIRGRRRALMGIAEQYDKLVRDADQQTIGIAHADCQEDVDYLISLLRANHPPKEIMTVMYEPVTGSHVGPGTVALFFFGDPGFRGQSDSLLDTITQKVDESKETLKATIEKKIRR